MASWGWLRPLSFICCLILYKTAMTLEIIRNKLLESSPQRAAVVIEYLLELSHSAILAIVDPGYSLGRPDYSQADSEVLVLVDDYRHFHSRITDRLLAGILPPNRYSFPSDVAGEAAVTAWSAVSISDFIQGTSAQARDLYFLIRLSRRTALLWSKDDQTVTAIEEAAEAASRCLISNTLAGLPSSFSLEEFSKKLLHLGLYADPATPKEIIIDRWYKPESCYYATLHRELLKQYARANRGAFKADQTPDRWTMRDPLSVRSAARNKAERMKKISARRNRWRQVKQRCLSDIFSR